MDNRNLASGCSVSGWGKKGKPVGCEKLLRREKTVHEAGV